MRIYECPCGAKLTHDQTYKHKLFDCPLRPGAPKTPQEGPSNG